MVKEFLFSFIFIYLSIKKFDLNSFFLEELNEDFEVEVKIEG